MRLYDNTRIKDFRRCPRYFMFRHCCDWRSDGETALPLIVGGCWGTAQDTIWTMIAGGETNMRIIAEAAITAFRAKWLEYGMPAELTMEQEEQMSPRTPGNFHEMIFDYIEQRGSIIRRKFELVECEHPFIVPLDPEDDSIFYVGRMDKLVRDVSRDKMLAIEHKTTTAYRKDKSTPFRREFLESFSPASQIDGYIYALHMEFPDKVGGVWIDAALVHKQVHDGFTFIPVERQLPHLDAWLWETRHWISQIEANKVAAFDTSKNAPYMAAFPKNTDACFDFNRSCEFLDLCKARPNPQMWFGQDEPPNGYHNDHWDPLDHMPKLKAEIEKMEKQNEAH
jgi:hypothetical protein